MKPNMEVGVALQRINSYLLLLICLGAIGSLYFFSNSFARYATQVDQSRALYNAALVDSKVQLSSLMQETLVDSTLKENVQWGLNHSIDKTLESNLRPRELDYLYVLGPNCEILGKAGALKGGAPCQTATLEKQLGSLQWHNQQGLATLSVSMPITDSEGAKKILLGGVILDDKWLEHQAALKPYVNTLELGIGFSGAHPRATMLAPETALQNNFGLFSDKFSLRFVSNASENLLDRINALIGALLLCCLGLAAHIWWTRRKNSSASDSSASQFLKWLKVSQGSTEEMIAAETTLSSELALSQARELITNMREDFATQLEEANDKNFQLTSDIRAKEALLRQQQKRFLDFANLESLALQLNRCLQTMKTDLAKLQTLSEDVVDTLVHGASRNLHALAAILRSWKNDINLRGARRFARSATEQVNEQDVSILEEQIATLMQISQQTEDQVLHASGFAQKITSISHEADRLSKHWFDLTHQADIASDSTNLLEVVLAAQGLLSDANKQRVRFTNQFDLAAVTPKNVPIGKAVWTSVMFHVYAALCEEVFAKQAGELMTSFRELPDSRNLIVASHISSAGFEQRLSQSHHIEVAQKLAKRHGLTMSVMPAATGLTGFNVSWPANTVGTSPNRSIIKEKPRPQPSL